jgi:hypothetical protein
MSMPLPAPSELVSVLTALAVLVVLVVVAMEGRTAIRAAD